MMLCHGPSSKDAVIPNWRWQYDNPFWSRSGWKVRLHYSYHRREEASNPFYATHRVFLRSVNSVGRVSPLHGECRRFEPVTEYQLSLDVASSNVSPPSDAWSEQTQLSHPAPLLRCRLVVGQQVLILLTVVRIHAPQPVYFCNEMCYNPL